MLSLDSTYDCSQSIQLNSFHVRKSILVFTSQLPASTSNKWAIPNILRIFTTHILFLLLLQTFSSPCELSAIPRSFASSSSTTHSLCARPVLSRTLNRASTRPGKRPRNTPHCSEEPTDTHAQSFLIFPFLKDDVPVHLIL